MAETTIDFDKYSLGTTAEKIALHTSEDNAAAVLALAKQVRRKFDIFSRDLDPRVFDSGLLSRELRDRMTRSKDFRLRILVRDTSGVVMKGHRLLELARKLSSFAEIRKANNDFPDSGQSFVVADGVGYVHRFSHDHYTAAADFFGPPDAKDLLRTMAELWQRSEPDSELRRLYI